MRMSVIMSMHEELTIMMMGVKIMMVMNLIKFE